jgi:uncharacterized RmlC-like cupin family protein
MPPASTRETPATKPDGLSSTNASIATHERSTKFGPPLQSTPDNPGRTRPAPVPGPVLERSGGPFVSPASPPSSALARCVGDVEHFTTHHWGRRPLLATQPALSNGAGADLFDDILSLDAVDALVTRGARLPTVRMVVDGSPLAPSRFCSTTRLGGQVLDDVVDPVKILARFAEGATLVMQSLHRTSETVASFAARLQDEISHPVQANAYLTPPDAAGLTEHGDLHDVLALQLHGSKRWWVDGLGDVMMHPGDVMYVPRGVRHRADTATETSLHLTIGIIRVTYRQVIDRVLRTGPESLDDPLPIGYRHRARRDELERGLDGALDDVLDRIGTTDLSELADHEQARRLVRPPEAGRISSIVHVDEVGLGAVIRWIAPEPLARAVDEVDGRQSHWDGLRCHDRWTPPERITIDLGDRRLTMPASALEALRRLSDGSQIRVGDLPGLDEPSRVVLAKRLVREAACVIDRVA